MENYNKPNPGAEAESANSENTTSEGKMNENTSSENQAAEASAPQNSMNANPTSPMNSEQGYGEQPMSYSEQATTSNESTANYSAPSSENQASSYNEMNSAQTGAASYSAKTEPSGYSGQGEASYQDSNSTSSQNYSQSNCSQGTYEQPAAHAQQSNSGQPAHVNQEGQASQPSQPSQAYQQPQSAYSNQTSQATPNQVAQPQTPAFEEKFDVEGKKVMVVGLGRTGVSLVKFLVSLGAEVTISDHKSKAELIESLEHLGDLEINFDLGGHTPKTFVQQDLVILSPGISPSLKIFDYVRSHGVRVTGEFEFSASFIKEPMIAVTGTNGKSTTCVLIREMLKESGKNPWLGGNFGAPLTEYLLSGEKADVVIAEVSSFQLEHVEKFNPQNIVFMNLAENHLDRYRTMEDYINAKRKIFFNTNQATTSILNADDNAVVELARDPMVQRGRIFYVSRKPALEPQIMNIGGAVCIDKEIRIRTGPEIEYFTVQNMLMKGKHSIENIMAASIASREHGATHNSIQRVIDEFRGMAHRLEYVRKVGGVNFYNDSKATNVHAVIRALDAFEENVILIMGGKDTNLNYEPLREIVRRKVKNLILVGEAKERINRDIGDYSETFLIGTFEEAVHISYQKSRNGDTVLLSPGASSFDMFDSYVERGNYYKDLVFKFA